MMMLLGKAGEGSDPDIWASRRSRRSRRGRRRRRRGMIKEAKRDQECNSNAPSTLMQSKQYNAMQ